jgi:hypothetical protein
MADPNAPDIAQKAFVQRQGKEGAEPVGPGRAQVISARLLPEDLPRLWNGKEKVIEILGKVMPSL